MAIRGRFEEQRNMEERWCEHRPGYQREIIQSSSLLEVNIRVTLTYHHHPQAV